MSEIETPRGRALAFTADLIEQLIVEADWVNRPMGGITYIEIAIDLDEFAEWVINSLIENGLLEKEPTHG